MHMGDDGRALVSTTHTGASTSPAMPQPSHEDAFIRKSDIETLIKTLNANSVHPDPEGDNEHESTPETPEDASASVHDQDGAESGDQYDGVTMEYHGKAFNIYIIGFGQEVYMKDYYPSRFYWGLCLVLSG
ncbi:hypothetical protein F2Q69_00012178 [Brassica cretica]|uniref:Uncharacterized protein n=1 Tax=Brassica cretica TaxID=69181 RepID=A0A8S9QUE0_BRACR|nr:hypothetical protein F2Q69_00012178 [Brassica cretica]